MIIECSRCGNVLKPEDNCCSKCGSRDRSVTLTESVKAYEM
jgi:uncharacterized OB-fold protein